MSEKEKHGGAVHIQLELQDDLAARLERRARELNVSVEEILKKFIEEGLRKDLRTKGRGC
ncbi:MAG TPA: ribbon-helix-helix protein, CopG family [Oculatellaceae cyanobacterium]